MQVQGGTTAAIRIRAFDFTGTEGDTDVTNSLNNTVVAIIAGSVMVNGIAAASLADITVTVDGDSIVIEGLTMGDNVSFEASSDFESVELSNANGDPDGQGSTFTGDAFATGAFGFDNVIEGDEIALAFDMLATDADGDTSNGTLDVTISPEGHVALGTDLDEVLIGDSGVDILIGGGGDDILIGNNGNDTMTGGTGADVFIWSEGQSGTDTITDFNIGEGDVLNIADLLVGENDPTAAELDAYMSIASGTDTTITIFGDQGNADQIIQLTGFDSTGMNGVQIIESLLSNGNLVTD
jgi:Ca2+-binding RTX toxin-like protein